MQLNPAEAGSCFSNGFKTNLRVIPKIDYTSKHANFSKYNNKRQDLIDREL